MEEYSAWVSPGKRRGQREKSCHPAIIKNSSVTSSPVFPSHPPPAALRSVSPCQMNQMMIRGDERSRFNFFQVFYSLLSRTPGDREESQKQLENERY